MPRQQMRLSEAIDTYMTIRENQGYAHNTLRSQKRVLVKMLTDIGNIYVHSVQSRHVDSFFAHQADTWSPGSMNLNRTHVGTFFNWCKSRGILDRDVDPMENTRRRVVAERDRLRIPVQRFGEALDLASHPRDRMVIALGLFLFLRASEMQSPKLADLYLDSDEILVTVHKAHGLQDRMPVSAPLRQELNRWLTYYTQQVGVLQPDMFLVPALGGLPGVYDPVKRQIQGVGLAGANAPLRPYSRLSVPAAVMQRVLVKMGYPAHGEGIHTLRRSGARALYDELADSGKHDRALEIVSAMLHHKDMQTTQHYLGLQESRMRRDDIIKGKQMFAGMIVPASVTPLRSAQ